MNANRPVKELLLLFGVKDIASLKSDDISKYFDDLSVKEVIKLCKINSQLSSVCKFDSMWERKVKNDYGIDKKYGKTWKETAIFLFDTNMINLNAIWDGHESYRKLFKRGLDDPSPDLLQSYMGDSLVSSFVFPGYVVDMKSAKRFILTTYLDSNERISNDFETKEDYEQYFEEFNSENGGILDSEEFIEEHLRKMTREFSIITHAVSEIKKDFGKHKYGLANIVAVTNSDTEPTAKQNRMNDKIMLFIDPMLYVMSYCLMTNENLSSTPIWYL